MDDRVIRLEREVRELRQQFDRIVRAFGAVAGVTTTAYAAVDNSTEAYRERKRQARQENARRRNGARLRVSGETGAAAGQAPANGGRD